MADRTVADIMTTDPVTVDPGITVTEAAQLMVDNEIGALPVLENGELIGIVTEGDLIMQDVKLEYPTYLHLLDGFIMYPPSTAALRDRAQEGRGCRRACGHDGRSGDHPGSDASIEDAATLLVDKDVSRIPVLDGDTARRNREQVRHRPLAAGSRSSVRCTDVLRSRRDRPRSDRAQRHAPSRVAGARRAVQAVVKADGYGHGGGGERQAAVRARGGSAGCCHRR